MEHIVQEGINAKKNSNPEAFLKTSWKRYQNKKNREWEKSCPKNLSGKGVDMVADWSIVLFSILWRQAFSRFLRQGEMNAWQTNPKGRLRGGYCSVELNILVLLSLTNFYKPRDVF